MFYGFFALLVLNFFLINLRSFYIGATISQNYDHNYRKIVGLSWATIDY